MGGERGVKEGRGGVEEVSLEGGGRIHAGRACRPACRGASVKLYGEIDALMLV